MVSHSEIKAKHLYKLRKVFFSLFVFNKFNAFLLLENLLQQRKGIVCKLSSIAGIEVPAKRPIFVVNFFLQKPFTVLTLILTILYRRTSLSAAFSSSSAIKLAY